MVDSHDIDPHDIDAAKFASEQGQSEAMAALHALAQQYHAVFSTDIGIKVLEDLFRCHNQSTTGSSSRNTDILSAQRDVVLRIDQMCAIAGQPPDRAYSAGFYQQMMYPGKRYAY